MARISNREKILTEGLRLVHRRGFIGSSVRDIVQAAGVPQGSFTNHFVSKEAFGLEILDLYFEDTRAVLHLTLRNGDLSPLERLKAYVDAGIAHMREGEMRSGCFYGNLGAEVPEHSEALRQRLMQIFDELAASIADCLAAAVVAEELAASTDAGGLARIIIAALQGSILLSKVYRDEGPMLQFKRQVFTSLLRYGSRGGPFETAMAAELQPAV